MSFTYATGKTHICFTMLLVLTYLFFPQGFAQTIVVTNPTNPWTVPAGVTSIKVEIWGGGGGGGGCNSTLLGSYGSGGGGGAYNVATFPVSGGQTYTIMRGAGGTGSSDANGSNGTASSVSGPGGSLSSNPGTGGARRGGTAGTGGTSGFSNGGNGGRATSYGAGGGGGAGNASPSGTGNGGDGSNTAAGSAGAGTLPGGSGGAYRNSNGNGNGGASPGGGGGGGYQTFLNGSKTGGAGAAGQVVITYTNISGTTITGFSPGNACSGSGQLVSITGTNFTGATAVIFYNGQSALFTVNSATQITATMPIGATTGPISVTTPSGTGISSGSFTVNALPGAPMPGIITQPTCAISTGSVVLNSLPATGTWTLTRTPGGTTTSGTGASTIIAGLVAGTYTYTVTNAPGCTSIASANIGINLQPVTPIVPNQTASISSGATFTVTPGGGTIPVGTTYTWTAPTYTGGVTGGTAQAAPQTNIRETLTIPSGSGTATYTVTPTSGICIGATFTVIVTVNALCVPVTIVTQPTNITMCATSGNASFTVVASGATPFTYQWQYLNGSTWAVVINGTPAGASYTNSTTATLSVNGITTGGNFQYRCYISNCSGGNNVTSSAANLLVDALPVSLSSSDADNAFCLGTIVTFTAGGGTDYNFRVGGVIVQSGPSTTYTTNSLANGQIVTVTVTSIGGCTATSAPIQNIVNPLPFIIISSLATCSIDLSTYSLGVAVGGSGTVTSTSGIVTNTGGNIWTIVGVLSGTNIAIKVSDNGGCENTLYVTSPNCNCPAVQPPVSGGNKTYCASGIIPSLNATVLAGETVDWFGSASGGALLGSGLSYTPTGPGTYYAMARNTTTSCTSSSRTPISVTMNPLPAPTLISSDGDNIFCAGTSIIFTAGGGITYNFRLGGISVQNGSSATYTINSLTNGQVVDVIVTNATGCTAASASITNTVSARPVPTLTSSDADNIICAGTNVIFTAGGGTNYNFRLGGVSVQNGSSATYTTNSLTNGQVVDVIVTNANGCIAASTGITNIVYAVPTANAGTGGNNCGLGFRLNGSLNNGTGTWSKVSGPGNVTFSPDANTGNAIVTVTDYGGYTFSWTVVNGTCSTSGNVTIVFIQQPPANAGSGGDECDNDFIMNGLATIGSGTWTKVTGPGNAVFTPDINQANAKVTVDKFGAYDFAWTVVNSTCTSTANVRVVFHNLPAVNAGKDSIICKGSSIQLLAQGSGSLSWIPAALVSNPNILNPIVTPEITTMFTVNVTDQFGCKNSDNIVVGVREKPVAEAGPDQVLEYVFTTTMDAKLVYSYEKGLWSVSSGTGVFLESTDARTAVSSLTLGINKFLWTITNGVCASAQDTVVIVVNNFVITTMITPNMDGRNDYFELRGLTTFGKTELIIFDRWGVLVFKNSDYDNKWNGVDNNNNPLPDDTYFYVLKTKSGKSFNGYIVIRR
jgi:gliding motility-associated-like protein